VISGCGRILERSSVRHDVERRNEVYARGTRTMPGRPLSVVAGLLIVAAKMPVSIEEAHAQAPRREIVGRNAPALAHGPPAPAAGERRPLLEAIRERRRAAKRAPTTKPRVGDSLRLDPVAAAGISPAGGEGAGAGAGTVCDACFSGRVVCDEPVSGFLGGNDCILTDGTFVEAWRFEIARPAEVTVRLASLVFDTFLFLTDDTCALIALNDDCTQGDLSLSCITASLDPGVYYVVPNTFAPNEGGSYELTVVCDGGGPADDICGPACVDGLAHCGETVRGSLGAGDCTLQSNGSFVDTYELTLTATRNLRIDLTSASFDPTLLLLDERCTTVAMNDDCTPDDPVRSCLTVNALAGTYFIGVNGSSAGGVGSYTLTIFDCGEPISPCQNCLIGSVECAVPAEGTLAEGDCVLEDGGLLDIWSFDVPNDGPVTVELDSTAVDPSLTVVARNCVDVLGSGAECEGGVPAASCLTLDLEAGSYYVFVASSGPGEPAAYTLTLGTEGCEPETPPCQDCEVGVIDCDEILTATLGAQPCTIDDRRPVDYWRLDIPIGANVATRIELESTDGAFNPVLVLFDRDCNEILRNDDCVEDTRASCLEIELGPGRYHIGVSSFFNDEVGEYTLFADCGGVNLRSVPGDCNANGGVELTDAVCLFGYLFVGDENNRLPCGDGTLNSPDNVTLLNWNGDPNVNLTDGIGVLNYLFTRGAPPALGLDRCLALDTCPAACAP